MLSIEIKLNTTINMIAVTSLKTIPAKKNIGEDLLSNPKNNNNPISNDCM